MLLPEWSSLRAMISEMEMCRRACDEVGEAEGIVHWAEGALANVSGRDRVRAYDDGVGDLPDLGGGEVGAGRGSSS